MSSLDADALLKAFVADGNKVKRHPELVFTGPFTLIWKGSGSTLDLGKNLTVSRGSFKFVSGGGSILIGPGCTVKGNLEVSGGGTISIGEGTFINRVSDIRAGEGASVIIGKKCLFANVKILTSDMHSIIDIGRNTRSNPARGIVIEDEVWIAEDTKIAKGVRVGTGSVIASGSLVTKSVAPFSLAAGSPAKVIRHGVTWTRKLQNSPAIDAPQFQPDDIPLHEEIFRHLASKKDFALLEAVISRHPENDLPTFALWYLVLSRHELGITHHSMRSILDRIISEFPKHTDAIELRNRLEKT